MAIPHALIAQTLAFPIAQSETEMSGGDVLLWSLILIGFVSVAFVGVVWVKKRVAEAEDTHGDGFSLADLRQLHKSGQMTDEEYEKAKALLIASLGKQKKDTPPPREWPGMDTRPPGSA